MAIINGKNLQLITSGAIPQKQMEEHKKFLGSSKKDFIQQGYEPGTSTDGILAHWDNVPLAYYGIPTANMMIYSEKLWDMILANETINQLIETGAYWMENDHKDEAETKVDNASGRICQHQKAPHNLIIGSLDIIDTPAGRKAYIMSKLGAVGTSTRGFGVLDPIGHGLTNVNENEYVHVDSDFVTIPAVPVSRIQFGKDVTSNLVNSEDEQLRKLVLSMFEQNPKDYQLLQLANAVTHGKYENDLREQERTMRIAASLKRLKA